MGIVYRLSDVRRVNPRVTMDATASEVNATAPPWKFSYLTVADFLDKLGSGLWLISIDLAACLLQPVAPPFQITTLRSSPVRLHHELCLVWHQQLSCTKCQLRGAFRRRRCFWPPLRGWRWF